MPPVEKTPTRMGTIMRLTHAHRVSAGSGARGGSRSLAIPIKTRSADGVSATFVAVFFARVFQVCIRHARSLRELTICSEALLDFPYVT